MRNKRNSTIALVLGTIACLVGGWLLLRGATSLTTFPLNTLSPQGRKADIIYDLVVPVFAIAGLVFILVEVGVVWMAYRFRRNEEDREGEGEPVQVHGNTGLEIGWTIVPALLLAVIAVFNANAILQMDDVREDAIDVTVIGQQWWWEYRYDTDSDGAVDIITASQLVMPAGRDVKLAIQSRDVIHSFWIPALNGKKDAVPGRTHDLVLEAAEPGIYEGQCTEFCGLSHGVMRMQVKVLDQADYDEWVDIMTTPPEQPTDDAAVAGQELFVQQCSTCHQVNGLEPGAQAPYEYAEMPNPNYGEDVGSTLLSQNAPNLTHLMMRDTFAGSLLDLYEDSDVNAIDSGVGLGSVVPEGEPNYNNLKRWLRNPESIKPMDPANNQGMPDLGLSEAQIDELVAYLVTLK
ncbi:MAG: cytochrome c oxidase subunit II [Microthrixaceae bacterium]|nr:cytochrome c oxidase subunit II [Microthrixaceae bacterium]